MSHYDPKTRSHYRDLIKAGELIQKLQDDILNIDPDHKGMSTSKVAACKVLLNKILPDIKSVELTGEEGKAIKTSLDINFVGTAVPEVCGPPVPGKFIDEK